MLDVLRLALALLFSTCGMALLALAMKGHWQQVRGDTALPGKTAVALRALGMSALLLSLWLYLEVDHVSMASLAWIMSLAVSALIVAFTLTWRPRWLAWMLLWVRGPACSSRQQADPRRSQSGGARFH